MRTGRSAGSGGFSLIELLVSATVIAVALLAHAASVVRHQRLSADGDERGTALLTAERFIERMRADTDWAGLYTRLRPLSVESTGDTTLSRLGPDLSLRTRAPTDYYADFSTPTRLGTVTVLVQVPSSTVSGVTALRENVSAPRYGLPADLNGDGSIDGNSRNSDYHALPVVVHLRWVHPGRDPQEVVVPAWLRGWN